MLYTQSESTITFSGLSSNVVEAPFGDAAYPSDDRLVVVLRDDGGSPAERAIHHAEVVDPDREQSRLLAEAIAREQMLIAREQAIRAQAIQASLETRDPVRTSYRVESRNSAWRRHEQDRHRWMVMALWMLMLAVCIAAVLIAFQLY